MLAASPGRSNVPPDYVKATPVGARATLAPQDFLNHGAIDETQPQPAVAPQKDAAIHELCRLPFAGPVFHRDGTTSRESNAVAATPAAPQAPQLGQAQQAPANTGQHLCPGCPRLHREHDNPESTQHEAGRKHEAAQVMIRSEFG